MDVVFLIGNGFDLNCGLKSSYNHMYSGYCTSPSKTGVIDRFKEEINHNIAQWSDFEKAIAHYGARLTNEEELLMCVRDFKKYLTQYLIKENSRFGEQISQLTHHNYIVDELINSFEFFYDNCGFPMSFVKSVERAKLLEGMRIQIIDFNYTNTLELLNKVNQKRILFDDDNILHIHGSLINDDIVIGVDDICQISPPYETTHSFERGVVKPIFNREYDIEKVAQAESIIKKCDIVCCFGMSFGITDNSWKKLIIDSMKNSEQSLIYYDYEMSKKEGLAIDQRMDESDLFKSRLAERWELNISDDILNKIYIPCGKNLFNIKLALDRQIQKDIKLRGVKPA